MDLLDRYLNAVRRHLPQAQADDIVAELRDVLLTRQEARAEALGRPLTAAEEGELIRGFGHPLLVAARYWTRQQLIGPEIYPFYVYFTRITLGIVAAVMIATGAASVVFGHADPAQVAARTLASMWSALITTVGVLTILFYLLDRYRLGVNLLERWRPENLPPVRVSRPAARWERMVELSVCGLFLLWWLGVIQPPPAPYGSLQFGLAPIFRELFWPITGVIVLDIASAVVALTLAGRGRLAGGLDLATAAANLVVVGLLLQAGHWIEVSIAGPEPRPLEGLARLFDLGFRAGLLVSAIVWTMKTIVRAWRLIRAFWRDGRGPAAATA